MKQLILLLITLFLSSFYTEAKIWRVNNRPGIQADFTEVDPAIAAASDGDTVMIAKSLTSYSGFTLDKRLVIMGEGGDLDLYFPSTYNAALRGTNIGGVILINAGAESSILYSFTHAGGGQNPFQINADNIRLIRCIFNTGVLLQRDNTVFEQCYISGNGFGLINSNVQNLVVKNCIINGTTSVLADVTSVWSNNIFGGSVGIEFINQTLINNINDNPFLVVNNCVLSNNIDAQLGSTLFGTDNGNFGNVDSSDVFVDANDLTQFQLKAGSPAVGAGLNGEDCGAFGGPTPFVIGLLPPVPWVYEVINPGTGSNTQPLNVTVSVQSNN
ncbi:MAG: hypothetical protein AAGG59_00880 [Bacteroidota bacterium]